MEVKQAKLSKNPVKHLLLVVLVGVLVTFVMSYRFATESWKGFWIAASIGGTIWLTQWFGHAKIYRFIDKLFGWKNHVPIRLVTHIIIAVIYASLGVAAVNYFLLTVWFKIQDDSFFDVLGQVWIVSSLIALGMSTIMTAVGFYRSMKQAITEREQMRAEMMSFKYESLRNQVNPHFLFNSLNVLTSLVEEEPKLAVKFIRQLSDVYRYVLDSQNKELVPLSEELTFIDSFVFLLKTRFEDALEVTFEVPYEAQSKLVVPMSLQLLIENAVKHNALSIQNPLHVEVKTSGDELIVANLKKAKPTPVESKKVGLENIRQRYEHFSEQGVVVKDQNDRFEVRLPLLSAESRAKQELVAQ